MDSCGEDEKSSNPTASEEDLFMHIDSEDTDSDGASIIFEDENPTTALITLGKSNTSSHSAAIGDNDPLPALLKTLELVSQRIAQLELRVSSQAQGGAAATSVERPHALKEEIYAARNGTRRTRRTPRSNQTNMFRDTVRKRVLSKLGIVRGQEPTWPLPSFSQACLYNKGEPSSEKPGNKKLIVDWACKGKTLWTKDCATTFAHDFITQYDRGGFPLLQPRPSIEKLEEVFLTYVLYLKLGWRRKHEDPGAAAARKAAADQRSRSINRREQLLGRRLALAKHHDLPDRSITLLENLDIDGMSSEESDGEIGTKRVFKIKSLPWRSGTKRLYHVDLTAVYARLATIFPIHVHQFPAFQPIFMIKLGSELAKHDMRDVLRQTCRHMTFPGSTSICIHHSNQLQTHP
ncbi:hypothetical protein M408DRAFT_317077 [Serendipita vermifera MAFF 305830]|uniref:Uncharacterized protein n=1 Tax=Serendipita vermifera MAFF 305830 TaxID=933852 RepID=A0A0C3AXS2_SERVB|nr:hypothetical protein M408DRAFT_317077 [Serendipita vermifera MAFF 305830]